MARIPSLLAALALGFPLMAQAPPAPAGQPAQPAKASVAVPEDSANGARNDELLVANATPYHPTLVRDPFAAPTDAAQTSKGDLVDDIAVKGRVVTGGKALAVVSDARGNIRWLPIGFKFRDGELMAIDDKSVTFHQWDIATMNTKIFKVVIKIYKREEAKR
jgi:hypothetical protein